MNKKNIIKILRQAKPDHIEWIKQAHKLLADLPQDQIKKPESCDACLLGKWHEQEGFKLVNIPQLNQLDELHRDVHNLYTALYYTTFDRRQNPRATIISAGVEIPIGEKQFRDKKLKLLEKKAVTLVRSIESIEKEVAKMSSQDFSSPWLS